MGGNRYAGTPTVWNPSCSDRSNAISQIIANLIQDGFQLVRIDNAFHSHNPKIHRFVKRVPKSSHRSCGQVH